MSSVIENIKRKLVFPIDYPSQDYVKNVTHKIFVIGLAVSCCFGLYTESVINTFLCFAGVLGIVLLLVVPPYPSYNEHRLHWVGSSIAEPVLDTIEGKGSVKSEPNTSFRGKGSIKTDVEVEIDT